MGPELMEEFKKQALRFGTETLFGEVTSVSLKQRPFQLTVDKETYSCDALIVATGATAKLLGIESEMKLMGRGVSACATCDGFFFKDRELVVVGGGDTAMEEATFLTKFASKVAVVHRRDKLRASKIMQERAMKNPKIEFVWNAAVVEVMGGREQGVTAVRLRDTVTGAERELPTQGLFVAIGHEPNTQLFRGLLAMNAAGYLRVEEPSTRTEIPGVFASAHNWYTYVLGEQGIVGTVLFVSVLATVALRLRSLSSRPRSVGFSVLAAFSAACLFLEVPTSFQTFAIPAIVLAAAFAADWSSRLADGTEVGPLAATSTAGGHP